jgi:hypothetical protein
MENGNRKSKMVNGKWKWKWKCKMVKWKMKMNYGNNVEMNYEND